MDRCKVCDENLSLPYECSRCGGTHCSAHQLPEKHGCNPKKPSRIRAAGLKTKRKIGATVRALFSVWGILFILVISAAIGLVIFWEDIQAGDIDEMEIEDGVVTVAVDSEHESDSIIIVHPDASDEPLTEQSLDSLGGTYEFDMRDIVDCSRNWPDKKFEVQLVSFEIEDESDILFGADFDVDSRMSFDVSDGVC